MKPTIILLENDVIDVIINDIENSKRRNVDGQIGFGDLASSSDDSSDLADVSFVYPEVDEYSQELLLKYEKEVSGMYLSGHPMKKYDELSKNIGCAYITDIVNEENTKYKDNDRVVILGLISSVKKKITKNDSTMAFVNLEDTTGSVEVIVFPKTLLAQPSMFYEGNVVLLHGRVSMREDEDTKIVCEVVEPCPSENSILKPSDSREKEKKKAKGLFLRFDNSSSPQIEVCEKLLLIFDGTVPLYYFFNDKKEYKSGKSK